jgi:trypsin
MKITLPIILLAVLLEQTTTVLADKKKHHDDGRDRRPGSGHIHKNKDAPAVSAYHQFSIGKKNTTADRSQNYNTHIVGGQQSQPGEFPYYVDLGGCGGSLIAPDIVLTAAHCGDYKGYDVLVGAFEAGETSNGAVYREVSKYKKDPNYNDYTSENDFALLKLQSPVTLSTILELSINDSMGSPSNGQDLTVLGLGLTTEGNGNSAANKLRDVEVQAIDTADCNAGSAYDGEVYDDSMFCAGVEGGVKDSCQGDSGGPIVIRDGNKHIQVGVVSWGTGCAQESYPGVYARVSSAHEWIKGVVCDDWGSDASFCDGDSGGGGDDGGGGGGGDTGGNDNCVTLTMDLLTDDYGSETGFFLVTSEDGEERIWDENDFGNNESHQFSACLDPTGCATLNIMDSFGDGIFAPDGVTLSYDGDVVYDSGDFGYGEVFNFGDACVSGGGGGGGGGGDGDTGGNDDCVTLTMDLLTDDYGSETEFFLVTSEDDAWIWDGYDFGNNESHQFSACLDPTGCATLDIFDWEGDGIFAPGGVTLTYDGDVVYGHTGDFGYGEVFRFGDGC